MQGTEDNNLDNDNNRYEAMNRMKLRLEKMLSKGHGSQLVWLISIIALTLIVLLIINWLFFGLDWPNVFNDFFTIGASGEHRWFKFFVALLGRLLFTALVISVFIKLFDNISASYARGESRYAFKDHILIIGAGRMLTDILSAVRNHKDLSKKDILVVTSADVERLRPQVETQVADGAFCNRICFYRAKRHLAKSLKESCADKASLIYIIGEDQEPGHDALSILCLNHLKELCGNEGPIIPCYIVVEMHTTLGVFNYMKEENPTRLNVEVINESDYAVERLLTETDFLPVLSKSDEGSRLHLVIAGHSKTSRAFASVAAQICHYPNFKGRATSTKITMVGFGRAAANTFVARYKTLLDLCHYTFISPTNVEEVNPDPEYGDFMDIEFEFIDGQLLSPFVISQLQSWVASPSEKTVLAICYDDDDTNNLMALNLPRAVYDSGIHIAVLQNNYAALIEKAQATGMYGHIYMFGKAVQGEDALFMRRSAMGKRVNRVYDLEYGNPPAADEDEAWRRLSYAHKCSSIASANSIALKMRCFNIQITDNHVHPLTADEVELLSEVEHRRWMATQLMLGYQAATKSERSDRSRFKELKNEHFIHQDIAPYSELQGEEEKDVLIVKNIPFIISSSSFPSEQPFLQEGADT